MCREQNVACLAMVFNQNAFEHDKTLNLFNLGGDCRLSHALDKLLPLIAPSLSIVVYLS